MSLRFATYRWRDGEEWMALRGPEEGLRVLIVPPLFEEMNFTRATLTALTCDLAERGLATALIDLPGTGESARPLEAVSWADWRDAVAAAAMALDRPHVLSLRGGALLDDVADAASRVRFAPAAGAALLRQMERAQAIGDREAARAAADPTAATLDLIGYRIPRPLAEAMRIATPADIAGPLLVLPFDGAGVAPWRRAEPAPDAATATTLAAAVAEWIASCAG